MSPCDGCGRPLDEERTSIHKVTAPDNTLAYVCDDCNDLFNDDPESLF